MAKPLSEINKTDFRNNYNIVRILTDINDIMKQLKTFNPNNQAVAFATRKKHESDKLDLILERLDKIESRLSNVETNQANDHKLIKQLANKQASDHKLLVKTNSLLLKVIELNNLKIE